MGSALEEGGFEVVVAGSGIEALSALDEMAERLAGLVTDIRLGSGPDGWEVARHGRELRPDLPVVYMTGDSAADWAVKGVPKSVLLQKPFAPAQLITAISTLMNERDSHAS